MKLPRSSCNWTRGIVASLVVFCSGLAPAATAARYDTSVRGFQTAAWLLLFRFAELLFAGMVITAAAVGMVMLTAGAVTGEWKSKGAADNFPKSLWARARETQLSPTCDRDSALENRSA